MVFGNPTHQKAIKEYIDSTIKTATNCLIHLHRTNQQNSLELISCNSSGKKDRKTFGASN